METKEIKINIPEGYEIDKENSTFECIKFKPIKKYITYKDVCNNIFVEKCGYYIGPSGNICDTSLKEFTCDVNNAPNKKQLERLLALNRLMNIAYYYNHHKYVEKGYIITYNREGCCYGVMDDNSSYYKLTAIDPIFEKIEDAQAVIDNPNFRYILDTLCK